MPTVQLPLDKKNPFNQEIKISLFNYQGFLKLVGLLFGLTVLKDVLGWNNFFCECEVGQ